MRVLFTTPYLDHPPIGGPQLRIDASIKALSRVCDLYLAPRIPDGPLRGAAWDGYYLASCRDVTHVPTWDNSLSRNRFIRKSQRILRQLRSDTEPGIQARALLALVDRHRIDVLWFGYGDISFPLIAAVKARRPSLKVVCDTDGVYSRFILRELPYQPDPERRAKVEAKGRAKEEEERAWVNLCDVTSTVSELEVDYYRSLAADPSRIHRFDNLVDLDAYRDPPPPAADITHPNLHLAGSFFSPNSPMVDAARWVIADILPLVRTRVPDARLYLVGAGADRHFANAADGSVVVHGRIPSVLPYLCYSDVALVPLRYESGTKYKMLEAGACGEPMVSTTLGAEGFPVVDGRDILIADEPASFADAIVRILTDHALASDLGAACRRVVEEQCDLDAGARQAAAILADLARVPTPAR